MAETMGQLRTVTPEELVGTGTPEEAPVKIRSPWLILALPLGVALVWVALAVMTTAAGTIRAGGTLIGATAAIMGVGAIVDRVTQRRNDVLLGFCVVWMVIVILAAILADVLPFAESLDQSKSFTELPRLRPDLFSNHPLGTDKQALDELGGVVYGTRVSLQVGFIAAAIGMLVGGLIGTIAGYFRGATDGVISLLTDALLAFPALILLLAIVSALDPSVTNISLVLATLSIPTYVRLARANTMVYAQREFVLAARSVGATHWRIIVRELAPNVIRPLLAYSMIIVAVLIVAEASLSFLGVGIQPPTPTWGNMISAGQTELEDTPHLVFVPGTVMFITVLALNRIGDWARTRWDPRQSKL